MERSKKILYNLLKVIGTDKGTVRCNQEQLEYHLMLMADYRLITGKLTDQGKSELDAIHEQDKNRIMDTMMDYEPIGYRMRKLCKFLLGGIHGYR